MEAGLGPTLERLRPTYPSRISIRLVLKDATKEFGTESRSVHAVIESSSFRLGSNARVSEKYNLSTGPPEDQKVSVSSLRSTGTLVFGITLIETFLCPQDYCNIRMECSTVVLALFLGSGKRGPEVDNYQRSLTPYFGIVVSTLVFLCRKWPSGRPWLRPRL